jgi:hypothetical protein
MQFQGGKRHACTLVVDVILCVEQHPFGVVVRPDLVHSMMVAPAERQVIAVHSQVANHEAHGCHHGVLHPHGVRAIKSGAGFCLFENLEHVAGEFLFVVDRPAAVDPVT